MTDEEILVWDQWFLTIGGDCLKQWEAVKETLPLTAWKNWACIIETNRIDDKMKKKASHNHEMENS